MNRSPNRERDVEWGASLVGTFEQREPNREQREQQTSERTTETTNNIQPMPLCIETEARSHLELGEETQVTGALLAARTAFYSDPLCSLSLFFRTEGEGGNNSENSARPTLPTSAPRPHPAYTPSGRGRGPQPAPAQAGRGRGLPCTRGDQAPEQTQRGIRQAHGHTVTRRTRASALARTHTYNSTR